MADMPPVSFCEVEQCFFNREQACHAPAINIGGSHPNCDTFITQSDHIHRDGNAGVGACHVAQCRWNNDMTCQASGIEVKMHSDHADCMTFDPMK